MRRTVWERGSRERKKGAELEGRGRIGERREGGEGRGEDERWRGGVGGEGSLIRLQESLCEIPPKQAHLRDSRRVPLPPPTPPPCLPPGPSLRAAGHSELTRLSRRPLPSRRRSGAAYASFPVVARVSPSPAAKVACACSLQHRQKNRMSAASDTASGAHAFLARPCSPSGLTI